MSDLLREAFLSDLRCREADALLLAEMTRQRLPALVGSSEDSEEDLVVRLRDPRAFGGLAESFLQDRRLAPPTRVALVEHTFDLLPLARSEGDVILVSSRAPPRLLALASFLAEHDALTVLHAMHLVYAVFLDRSLLEHVERTARQRVLESLLELPEVGERLRVLYAGLHLGSVPEAEAHADLGKILRSRDLPSSLKTTIASLVGEEDGGVLALARLARDEGLLPADAGDRGDPLVLANIPRMPSRLAPVAQRWLRKRSRPAMPNRERDGED